MNNTNLHYNKRNITLIILAVSLCFILVLCFLTMPKEKKLYTYEELSNMPAMELYELFLEEGLKLPDYYKSIEKEEIAENLKNNFDLLSQGFIVYNYSEHMEFVRAVKEVYEKIAEPRNKEEEAAFLPDDYFAEIGIENVLVKEQYIGEDGNLHVVYTIGKEYGNYIAVFEKNGDKYSLVANYTVDAYNKEMFPIKEIEGIEDEFLKDWVNNTSKLNLEQYYTDYKGKELQQIIIDETLSVLPDISPNIIYYKPDSDQSIETSLDKMIGIILKPYTKEENGLSYRITDYKIEKQKIISLSEEVFLIPYLDVYIKYDGTSIAGSMEQYMNAEPDVCKDGYMPLFRQGSTDDFMYILMEKDGVYRLQRLTDIIN